MFFHSEIQNFENCTQTVIHFYNEIQNFESCTQTSTCISLACNFIKKETLAQVSSCQFCQISKSNIFTEHLRATASINGVLNVLKTCCACSYNLRTYFHTWIAYIICLHVLVCLRALHDYVLVYVAWLLWSNVLSAYLRTCLFTFHCNS